MTPADRAYAVYCDIARVALGREPMSRERWDAIPKRSYFRQTTPHDDIQWDYDREAEGNAQ